MPLFYLCSIKLESRTNETHHAVDMIILVFFKGYVAPKIDKLFDQVIIPKIYTGNYSTLKRKFIYKVLIILD